MNIKEMHYDFKLKLNKIDSQQYKNLRIPEIDWILNEAQELFVKMVAEPRLRNALGFEVSQRNIDDIRSVVVNNAPLTITDNTSSLPNDYWHYLRGYVTMEKENCGTRKVRLTIQQHDDKFEESEFHKSSFEWRTVNGVFNKDGVTFYTDGTFNITEVFINYIKQLVFIHNADDFNASTYTRLDGTVLTGTTDCELPFQTHSEIVDIAVLIASNQLQIPDYQLKLNKLNLNNLIT